MWFRLQKACHSDVGCCRLQKACHSNGRLLQASESMSFLCWTVRGHGIYAFWSRHIKLLPLKPPPIDSRLRTCLRWNDIVGLLK